MGQKSHYNKRALEALTETQSSLQLRVTFTAHNALMSLGEFDLTLNTGYIFLPSCCVLASEPSKTPTKASNDDVDHFLKVMTKI